VTMKFIPDLIFAADTTFDESERIARLLHKPEVARDLGDDYLPPGSSDSESPDDES
jgi:hypothetical protein